MLMYRKYLNVVVTAVVLEAQLVTLLLLFAGLIWWRTTELRAMFGLA